MTQALLSVRNLSKTFPGLKALDDVSVSIGGGEIVALVGQNGSGKSTLVKILAGIHRADPGGSVELAGEGGGQPSSLHFIHQDLGLVGSLSTIENLDLGRELGRGALRRSPVRTEQQHARELIHGFGASFDVTAPVLSLTAAERAIVAIARALDGWTHDRNVLFLDEPTAALHGDEVHKLFDAVRKVAARGAGVVFISHRLDEVLELADRVVALRDGRLIADVPSEEVRHDDLVRLIAGKAADAQAAATVRGRGGAVLRARGIVGRSIHGLDLDLHAGEIVGVSGVLGSGREELAPILFGAAPATIAELQVAGAAVGRLEPRTAVAAGVAYVPGDRHRLGAVMTMSVRENMTLPRLRSLRRRLSGSLDGRRERREVDRWVGAVGVRPPLPERPLRLFSGGNQQKVILAKWLRNDPRVLLLEEPTQGIDVGAKAGIFKLVAEAAAAGAGVLVCSSDAKELAQICDRVLVLRDGDLVADLTRPQLSEAALISASLGPLEDDGRTAAVADLETRIDA